MEKSSYFNEDESLALYLKELNRCRPLSAKEEAELAARIRKGDQKALNRLVKANLRFVVSVARNYQNQGLPLIDLINEGNLGLLRAARRFDENKNFKFISYAVWWIRQAILQALAENSRIVKLPLNRVGRIHKIGKTQSRLEQKYQRMPHIDEIAKELQLEEEEVQDTLKIGNRYVSLDGPIKQNEQSTLMEAFQDESQKRADEHVIENSLNDAINKTLDTLSEKEKQIVKLYFGIDNETKHTLEEIAERFDITRERVRQIKEKALRSLQHPTNKKRLEIFWH